METVLPKSLYTPAETRRRNIPEESTRNGKLDSSGVGQGPGAGCREHDVDTAGSTRGCEFLD